MTKLSKACPLCGATDEEMGDCSCGQRMCVSCWHTNHACDTPGVSQ